MKVKPYHERAHAVGNAQCAKPESIDLDLDAIESPALSRLIQEVREEATVDRSYSRTYHRHNR